MTVSHNAVSPYFERLSIESPLEHYRACRILLARLNRNLSSPAFEKEYERLIRYPFASSFQPSIAALALAAIQLKRTHPPLTPLFFAKGLPVGELNGAWSQFQLLTPALAFELALLWFVAGALLGDEGLETAAKETMQVLCSLGPASFWLWRKDSELVGQEKYNHLLRWARGEPVAVEIGDLFARDLMETVKPPQWTEGHLAAYDRLGIAAFEAKEAAACFTLSGWNSGLGTFRLRDVEVRSFGPQGMPLSDLSLFGIAQWGSDKCQAHSELDRAAIEGWTRAFASKECWLQVKAQADCHRAMIDVRQFGPMPLPFAFYIKAEECALKEGPTLKPRSLQRYEGEPKEIVLDGHIIFSCSLPHRMQVIPLAGENCFWNSGFLISFEYSSSASFLFSIN